MWNVIGHASVIESLRSMLAAGTLPHALLLTGPPGVGKTTVAVELAKALNCTGSDPPCHACPHCRQIAASSHPDVSVVERVDGKDTIAIGQVRELREGASLRPFQGAMKVIIIAGAESLTAQAADALLKTLEEPQAQLLMVLTAVDTDGVPTTILSRCRTISLQAVGGEDIAEALVAGGTSPEVAENLARLARGSVGWALEAARSPKIAEQREELVKRLASMFGMGLDARLQLAEGLAADKKDRSGIRRQLEVLALLVRDLLLLHAGLEPELVRGETAQRLREWAGRHTLAQLHAIGAGLRGAMARVDQNVDPRLTLEALMVSLP